MTVALCSIIAILFVSLLLCIWRLVTQRREALRLHNQIQDFICGEITSPAFSVKDDRFALFENAVIELETRLLQSEESALREGAKNRAFVQDVSHQLKTPIAGLRLFCEVDESEHKQQKLQLVGRMESLTASLLKLEKLRSDGYAFEFRMCCLRELALDVKSHFLPLYPGKQIAVIGDASIRCDTYWMFEALANIVKNACEHTKEEGNVVVSIEQEDNGVTIRIDDDGGGVMPESVPRLFERFYRSSHPENAQGIGLGLAIAKTIVLKHHGSIRAENGTRGLAVMLYIPVLHTNLKKT